MVDTPPTSTGVVEIGLRAPGLVGAVIVTHASRVSRMDVLRTFDLFRETGVPIISLVCNQTGLHDLQESDIQELGVQFGIPSFISIPHSKDALELVPFYDRIANAVQELTPVVLKVKQPEDIIWQKLLQMSAALSGKRSS